MLYQNLGTCHEATETCIDKYLVLGQAILPPFNLKIQCSGISLFPLSGCYNWCPCTEWEMKLYLVPYFLRLLSHPTLVTALTGAQERTKCRVLERQPESMVCTGQRETSGRRSPDLAVPTDTVSGRGPETASRATLMTFWNPAIHHHPEFLVTNNFLSSSINLSYQKLLYMGTHCMHGL